jgi:hypothetical protein
LATFPKAMHASENTRPRCTYYNYKGLQGASEVRGPTSISEVEISESRKKKNLRISKAEKSRKLGRRKISKTWRRKISKSQKHKNLKSQKEQNLEISEANKILKTQKEKNL